MGDVLHWQPCAGEQARFHDEQLRACRVQLHRGRAIRQRRRRNLHRHRESRVMGTDPAADHLPRRNGFTIDDGSPEATCAFAAKVYAIVDAAFKATGHYPAKVMIPAPARTPRPVRAVGTPGRSPPRRLSCPAGRPTKLTRRTACISRSGYRSDRRTGIAPAQRRLPPRLQTPSWATPPAITAPTSRTAFRAPASPTTKRATTAPTRSPGPTARHRASRRPLLTLSVRPVQRRPAGTRQAR